VIPPRTGFSYTHPQVGLIEWMPVMKAGREVTIKVVGYHPCNPPLQGLPTIISTVSAYDTATGHLIGITDGAFITALRTGAMSAVASRLLASPHSQTVGIIGCGAQAVTQLHALSRVFDLEKVLVYDIDPSVGKSYLTRTAFMNLDIEVVPGRALDHLVKTADILCTCTSVEIGKGPVFEDVGMKPWLHINAIGSDFPGKFEVPLSVLKRSFVCPDFIDQAVKEGECQKLSLGEIGPSLVEVIQSPEGYSAAQESSTVFDSTGWALEDQVALEMLLDYARGLGVGDLVDLENIPGDPKNPYQFANHD
jgi:ornithine cyclodeaminase/alanine dehydrogenase-like protein (mu-crystallin family)